MKLGFGLYRHQLHADYFRFAKQCGATHLVVHVVDYFRSSRSNAPGDQPIGDDSGWGLAGDPDRLWSFEELSAVKAEAAEHGLQIQAIENFDPAHWHDILLDGPKKAQQLENLKTIIRTVGRVGIDMLRVLRILKQNGFDGVLIPDHAPQMTCEAPWHAGMAYACGWMKAALAAMDRDT